MTLVRRLGAAVVGALLVAMVPSCQSLPAVGFCQYDGRTYAIGATFRDAQDCNTCTCRDVYGGPVATCQTSYCEPAPPSRDKVDLLFVVDNSALMADNQAFLADAASRLVLDLASPECVDASGAPTGERAQAARPAGQECQRGTPRHPPVVDLHIGVLSSSLGGYGSDQCRATETDPLDPTLNAHKDDAAHLLNRAGPKQTPLPNAGPSNVLAWSPLATKNETTRPSPGTTPYQDLTALARDTASLVEGVGHAGCRFSSPLEAAYRFLVAPDPDDHTAPTPKLDTTLLAQRATFLRPDSALAVVLVTDQDDVSLDPDSLGGQGASYFESTFPLSANVPGAQRDPSRGGSTAPRGTSACPSEPGSVACRPCRSRGEPKVTADPACPENEGFHRKDEDDLAVRFHHVKERFGVDPRFPIRRYVNGFVQPRVPSSRTQHDASGGYVGGDSCQNPLFAAKLPLTANGLDDPTLCNLPRGPRRKQDIFVVVLGGIPDDLVGEGRPTAEQWMTIVEGPTRLDAPGLDARMFPFVAPRRGRPASTSPADREFDTKKLELQYACTFPLSAPQACTGNDPSCPCDGLTDIPICKVAERTHGKAVPSQRPLELASALYGQALIGSVCPVSTTLPREGEPEEPYGYRKTMKRLDAALGPRLKRP